MYYLTLLLCTVGAVGYFADGRILKGMEKTVERTSAEVKEEGNTGVDPTINKRSSDSDIKDRFGFTVNKAQAHAHGPGGFGASHAITFGSHVGILRPGQSYTPLFQNSGGYSTTFNSGPGAPNTWAQTSNDGRPGTIGGQGSSGFGGGKGNASADSYSVLHSIPLWDGTILLSNFDKNKTNVSKPIAGENSNITFP